MDGTESIGIRWNYRFPKNIKIRNYKNLDSIKKKNYSYLRRKIITSSDSKISKKVLIGANNLKIL